MVGRQLLPSGILQTQRKDPSRKEARDEGAVAITTSETRCTNSNLGDHTPLFAGSAQTMESSLGCSKSTKKDKGIHSLGQDVKR